MLEAFQTIAKLVADGSGWVLFAASWVLFAYGFWKGWWVPGWLHQREVDRGNRAEDAVEASVRTVHEAAAATQSATSTALTVADQLAGLQRAVARLGSRDESP